MKKTAVIAGMTHKRKTILIQCSRLLCLAALVAIAVQVTPAAADLAGIAGANVKKGRLTA